jgi:hypothetical protein
MLKQVFISSACLNSNRKILAKHFRILQFQKEAYFCTLNKFRQAGFVLDKKKRLESKYQMLSEKNSSDVDARLDHSQ